MTTKLIVYFLPFMAAYFERSRIYKEKVRREKRLVDTLEEISIKLSRLSEDLVYTPSRLESLMEKPEYLKGRLLPDW